MELRYDVGPVPLNGIVSKMFTYAFMVLILLITLQSGPVVSASNLRRARQNEAPTEKIHASCGDIDEHDIYCFGTRLNGSNLVMSTKGSGCIKNNDCTFLMVIKNMKGSSEVSWKAYQQASLEQDSGRFQVALRRTNVKATSCQAVKGSPDAKWPAGTFILEGDKQAISQTVDSKDSGSVFKPATPVIQVREPGNGRLYNKYQWTSPYDPKIDGTTLSLQNNVTSYAVKVWSDHKGARSYEGCINFVYAVELFSKDASSSYDPDGGTRNVNNATDDDSSLLWLWILLGLLLLLLIIALLIWLCCCRKTLPPDRPASTVQEPSTAGAAAPGSAAPGSGVHSAKPTSVVTPKSSAKPASSAAAGAPSERSMRSAYTTVPTGQSIAPSNATMRSKWSGAPSGAPSGASQVPTSKTPSKTGSKSKVGSSSPSKTPSSSGSKSSSSKNLY